MIVKVPLGDLPLRRAAGSGAVPRVPPWAAVYFDDYAGSVRVWCVLLRSTCPWGYRMFGVW
jgi:hypothetical protein